MKYEENNKKNVKSRRRKVGKFIDGCFVVCYDPCLDAIQAPKPRPSRLEPRNPRHRFNLLFNNGLPQNLDAPRFFSPISRRVYRTGIKGANRCCSIYHFLQSSDRHRFLFYLHGKGLATIFIARRKKWSVLV